MQNRPQSHTREHGAALFTALVFLLLMTFLGISGMNISRMENLMAGNSQVQVTVLADAELALAAGERQLENLLNQLPLMDWNTPGDAWYDRSVASTRRIDVLSPGWDFSYHAVTATSRYVIEFAGTEPIPGSNTPVAGTGACPAGSCVRVFLVTAQADAGRGARRTVQSVYVTTGARTDPGEPAGPNFRAGRRAWIDLQPQAAGT